MTAEMTNFTPPMEIAAWLACLAFFLMICFQVYRAVLMIRGDTPAPPNGELRQSIKQLSARMKNLEDWRIQLTEKMEQDKTQIIVAGEHRAEKLHERINDVLSAVSELRGKVNEMGQRR